MPRQRAMPVEEDIRVNAVMKIFPKATIRRNLWNGNPVIGSQRAVKIS